MALKKNNSGKITLTVIVLLIMLFIGMMWVMASCNVLHRATSNRQNDSQVTSTDSGQVHQAESTMKNKGDWYRESWQFLPGKHDTITNVYTKETLQPIYYTREGGSHQTEQRQFNFDSAWKAKQDSANRDQIKTAETNKTTVLSFWHLVAMGGIAAIVGAFLSRIKISLR